MLPKELSVTELNNSVKINVWNREYTLDNTAFFSSLKVKDSELLASPIRLVSRENGKISNWGETECFILENTPDFCTVLSTTASENFIVNTAIKAESDGFIKIDLKLMTRGMTVQQVFGLAEYVNKGYHLENLYLEIPLKTSEVNLYHFYPGNGNHVNDTQLSGSLDKGLELGFKSLVWLGNENSGLCFACESDENWQYNDKAIEIIKGEKETILRLNLLESFPQKWQSKDFEGEEHTYIPITFQFALQLTPTKPYPDNPFKRKILHIDCFCKIKEDYFDFLGSEFEDTGEIVYDRIQKLGVTTLVIHEKWNKLQNYWKVPPSIDKKIRSIITECHKRDIEVIPYFGYEICALADYWGDKASEYIRKQTPDGYNQGGWYRMPHQREYIACYNSKWSEDFTQGILGLIEDYGFDGIYLDTTCVPWGCMNESHGCGYTDSKGKKHLTYPIFATRQVMKTLYENLDPKGKFINPHTSNCCNIPALTYSHLNTDGELIQMLIRDNGTKAIPEGYLRSEYTGRNFGFPIDFLAYEYPPDWNFENSLPIALTLGIIPRVNNTGRPLEYMSKIWKILDSFPLSDSEFVGYWSNNEIAFTDSEVKISYYKSKDKYLVLMGKTSSGNTTGSLRFNFNIMDIRDELGNGSITLIDNEIPMEVIGDVPYIFVVKK